MKKQRTNKKTLVSIVSLLTIVVMILTGTFAWRTIQQAMTAGRGHDFAYAVALLDRTSNNPDAPTGQEHFHYLNWKENEKLPKKIYATSNFTDYKIAEIYEEVVNTVADGHEDYDSAKVDSADEIFSDTWVRIRISELYKVNDSVQTGGKTETANGIIVTEYDSTNKKLVSTFDDYFEIIAPQKPNPDAGGDGEPDTLDLGNIVLLEDWAADPEVERGRFWILDEATGWLYWAQPLAHPDHEDTTDLLKAQTTDEIVSAVDLIKRPSGAWSYTISAELEAIDIELDEYSVYTNGVLEELRAWPDITADDSDENDDIYKLFVGDSLTVAKDATDEFVLINPVNFPDANFRNFVKYNDAIDTNKDGILVKSELEALTELEIPDTLDIKNLSGIEFFTSLTELDVSDLNLTSLDLSANTLLTKLDASNNSLTSINLSGLDVLAELNLNNNALTTLNVGTNGSLDVDKFTVTDNHLTSLILPPEMFDDGVCGLAPAAYEDQTNAAGEGITVTITEYKAPEPAEPEEP